MPVAAAVGAPLPILVGDAALFVWLLLLVAAHLSVEVVAEATAHQQPVPGNCRQKHARRKHAKLGGGMLVLAVGLLLLVAVHFLADFAPLFVVVETTAH